MNAEIDQDKASLKVLQDSQNVEFPYSIEFEGLNIIVYKDVFSPKHFKGWFIFNKHFPSVRNEEVLEVGTGTGVTAIHLSRKGAKHVLAVDINPHAVKNAQENVTRNQVQNVEVRKSDVFSSIEVDERFDSIYWNTPFMYKPESYKYRNVLERGLFDPGYKITERFLREGKKFLKEDGRILFGTGNFGDVPRFKALAEKHGYTVQLLAKEASTEINPVTFELYELKPQ